MKLLKDYSIHVITENNLLRKVLSYLFAHIGTENIHFHDNLRTLVMEMRQCKAPKSLIFIDMPYHIEELRLYSDKLAFIPIFIMQQDGKNPTVNVVECLKAVSQLREKVSHLHDTKKLEAFHIDNTDETPKATLLDNIFEGLDMEKFLQLDLYLHPLSKPLSLCGLAQALIPVLTDIDEESFAIPLRFIKPTLDTSNSSFDDNTLTPSIPSFYSDLMNHHSIHSPVSTFINTTTLY